MPVGTGLSGENTSTSWPTSRKYWTILLSVSETPSTTPEYTPVNTAMRSRCSGGSNGGGGVARCG
ncbi:hypothetical protein DIPPA_21102 [Diplonema papillatum]|nr:hypothetical protein DIPPA_21102 [Diplonema papillatum]